LLQDYLRNVARKYNLYKYIRFNTSVEAATWDDSKNRWKVDVNVTGGKDAEFNPAYSIECDFLVSAVGQLNQPQYPDIEGLENFKGKIMHSARWDWSHRLEGRSVGIIGNGMRSIICLEQRILTNTQVPRLLRSSQKSYRKPLP